MFPVYYSSGAMILFNDTSYPKYQSLHWISKEDYFVGRNQEEFKTYSRKICCNNVQQQV